METPMTRKQIQIPGTERKAHPEVEAAAQAYATVRDERSDLSKREHQKKIELLVTMKAHKLTVYKFYDDNGEEVVARIDEAEPKVTVRKTGEAEPEIGQGVSSGSEEKKPAGMDGLIAQAMKAQDDAVSVEVDAEGDVTVPDKSAPKKPKKGKAKKS
jgi:hypothetical protein